MNEPILKTEEILVCFGMVLFCYFKVLNGYQDSFNLLLCFFEIHNA